MTFENIIMLLIHVVGYTFVIKFGILSLCILLIIGLFKAYLRDRAIAKTI